VHDEGFGDVGTYEPPCDEDVYREAMPCLEATWQAVQALRNRLDALPSNRRLRRDPLWVDGLVILRREQARAETVLDADLVDFADLICAALTELTEGLLAIVERLLALLDQPTALAPPISHEAPPPRPLRSSAAAAHAPPAFAHPVGGLVAA
jgi:hypothetical protein